MKTLSDAGIIDMVNHGELLLLYRDYVARCIEESTFVSPSRPVGFDDWQADAFSSGVDEHTTVIVVTLNWEQAARGYLCGGDTRDYRIRVPATLLTQSGEVLDVVGLRRIAGKFARKMNRRLPSVVYRAERIYHWTWD